MNVNPYYTTDYENISDWTLSENKPNSKPIQSQFKANLCPRYQTQSCAIGTCAIGISKAKNAFLLTSHLLYAIITSTEKSVRIRKST